MYDITELERIFSSVHQSVIGIDSKNHEIIFANSAAKAFLGDDLIGKPLKTLVSEDILTEDSASYMCGTAFNGKKAGVSVVRGSDTILLYIDVLADDLPRLSVTRHMISSLRNSAMGIKISADRCFSMLEEGKAPNEKHISILYHYYYALLRTLIQIDSADQLERGEMLFSPVPTDLITLCGELTDSISLLCADFGVKISFTTQESQLVAVVDPEKIEQLLLNLFANSLQHTSPGKHIDLSLAVSGNRIILSLDDDGEGIPQGALSKIFKLPDSADMRRRGNGLGLYISLGIAQLHKGMMLVESREGDGTRVRVMLPVDESPSPKFNCPETPYRLSGLSTILTELSEVLPAKSYGLKYED
jgi:hypothetical protein